MSCKRIPLDLNTKEGIAAWHALRHEHIGASEVAALFQCHNFITAFQLYHNKRGMLPDMGGENLLTEWGKHVEPFVARVIAQEHGWELRKTSEYLESLEHPHLGITLDYDVVQSEFGPGILEVKVVTHDSKEAWSAERAPDYIEWQIQQQLLVSGASWGAIAAMFYGDPQNTMVMVRKPNLKAFKAIINRSGEFWANMKAGGKEPDVEGADDYGPLSDIWMQLPEQAYQEPIDLSGEKNIDGMIEEYKALQADATGLSKQAKDLKAQILQLCMQKAEGQAPRYLTTNQYELKLQRQARKGYTVQPTDILDFRIRQTDIVGGNYGN